MSRTRYAIAIGSNRRHGRYGAPASVVRAAVEALAAEGLTVQATSDIRSTPALGPAGRSFANAAVIVESELAPDALLDRLKAIERRFGRRGGRRWGPRVLDLDIILWSGGSYADAGIVVPHPAFRRRRFVLDPVAQLVPGWRDPITGASIRQLRARATRRRPL
jgi:2-amino-4-hydroxy-6-hydroxymethyldihydropteridine diphosphokinase